MLSEHEARPAVPRVGTRAPCAGEGPWSSHAQGGDDQEQGDPGQTLLQIVESVDKSPWAHSRTQGLGSDAFGGKDDSAGSVSLQCHQMPRSAWHHGQ